MKEEKTFIGIDLGTTYCSIAYLDETGTPVIEKNMDGEEETPSAIFFDPRGEIYVGSSAKGKAEVYPEYTVTQVKRKMGTDKKYSINDRVYTPIELSAMILKRIVDDFRKTKGQAVTDAVITVPATFGDVAREATKIAANIAGITNVSILNEPTAAAIAYGYGTMDGGHKRILVFDFGGGTVDVTILDVNGSEFRAIATDGDIGLGGVDFDNELRKIIFEKIATNTGMDYSILDSDPYLLSDLEIRSERMKIRLSSSEIASDTITLDNGVRTTFEVTREEFENATRTLVDESLICVDKVLKAARCTIDEINSFVLVGGSSRIPMVAETISARYPGAKIEIYDALHAVAKGAAIFAGRDETETPTTNILAKTFGVKVGNDDEGYRISNIIYRNSQLPVSSSGRFRPQEDGQLKTIIEIYESSAYDMDKHTDLGDASLVGQFELELPEAVSVSTPIMVQFNTSTEGILTAVAECGSRKERYVLKTPVSITASEIEQAGELMEKVAEGPVPEETN